MSKIPWEEIDKLPEIITVSHIKKILGVSYERVRQLMGVGEYKYRNKKIPYTQKRKGSKYQIDKKRFIEWLEERENRCIHHDRKKITQEEALEWTDEDGNEYTIEDLM